MNSCPKELECWLRWLLLLLLLFIFFDITVSHINMHVRRYRNENGERITVSNDDDDDVLIVDVVIIVNLNIYRAATMMSSSIIRVYLFVISVNCVYFLISSTLPNAQSRQVAIIVIM